MSMPAALSEAVHRTGLPCLRIDIYLTDSTVSAVAAQKASCVQVVRLNVCELLSRAVTDSPSLDRQGSHLGSPSTTSSLSAMGQPGSHTASI